MRSTFVNKHLTFSKKERIAILVLLLAICCVIILPYITTSHRRYTDITTSADTAWLMAANALQQKPMSNPSKTNSEDKNKYQYIQSENFSQPTPNTPLFVFDPNMAEVEDLRRLGLREKTIQILVNYRNKGGKFKKAEDLQKIYGLKQEEYERLLPYIVITPPTSAPSSSLPLRSTYMEDVVKSRPTLIEINSADRETFKSLYGIGDKLATRIINFRNKLGGFYSIEQIGETYGLADSVFNKIKPHLQVNAEMVQKINVNTATYDELNNHPYINSQTAYQILKYRKENGSINDIEAIKSLVQPNDVFDKIKHYIKTE